MIDPERCTHCRQCLQFCVFGVYSLDAAGKVRATSPDSCKPGCPACARVCPQGAIMFPLHAEPGIAGAPGATVTYSPVVRQQWYRRLRRTCPQCGRTGGGDGRAVDACPECGGHGAVAPKTVTGGDGLDPLQADLERLDRLRRGTRS